jgi:hypothetical protein
MKFTPAMFSTDIMPVILAGLPVHWARNCAKQPRIARLRPVDSPGARDIIVWQPGNK